MCLWMNRAPFSCLFASVPGYSYFIILYLNHTAYSSPLMCVWKQRALLSSCPTTENFLKYALVRRGFPCSSCTNSCLLLASQLCDAPNNHARDVPKQFYLWLIFKHCCQKFGQYYARGITEPSGC